MNQDPSHPRRGPIFWLMGIIAGVALTAALYLGIGFLYAAAYGTPFETAANAFGLPSFFLVPIFGGAVASWFWRSQNPTLGGTALAVLGMTILALGGSVIFLGEGVICLLIVSPLLYVMLLAGALLGRSWFKSDPTRLRLSIVPLLALLALAEPAVRSDRTGVVIDEIRINAPPSKVWPQLTSFPAIATPPRFWMFQLGLPYPMETTSQGDFVGAGRQCIFSGGMIFDEKVVTCLPNADLTFDITALPQHPELIGHITPSRGQFLLRDNGDGTTTLVGSTWYTLHVRPLWYFDWWTHQIFRAVHLRVMEDVRQRAERG